MIDINLAYPEKSQVGFKIIQEPDGHQNVQLSSEINQLFIAEGITIKSRISNYKDIENIINVTNKLKTRNKNAEITLYVPYLMGSGEDNFTYFDTVIASLINAQNYHKVLTFDPISTVPKRCINNLVEIDNTNFIKQVLMDINGGKIMQHTNLISENNAVKNISELNIDTPVTYVDISELNITKTAFENYVVFATSCVYSKKYNDISKQIKKENPHAKIYFITSHGVFTNGFYSLSNNFDKIYTTDSFSKINEADTLIQTGLIKQVNII